MTSATGPVAGQPSCPLIQAAGLSRYFRPGNALIQKGPVVRAVDGVDLSIAPGEIFGLVGESGCGKSTLGRLMAGLIEPTGGSIRLEGRPLTGPGAISLPAYRRTVQMVFQDPYASLNPSFRVADILAEGFGLRGGLRGTARREAMESLMDQVGLGRDLMGRFPHQLSGGQRQRVGIARALATGARFLILDEPVSALDVSVQSQILNLLIDLQARLGLTYVFISHDLGVIRYICDRVAVMYLGRIVEVGETAAVLSQPRHPYTRGLLDSVPRPSDRGIRNRRILAGELPSPLDVPQGCRFHPRCPFATTECRTREPRENEVGPGHQVACFHPV